MTRTAGEGGYITLAVLVMAGIMAGVVSTLLVVSRPALGLARLQADEVAAEGLTEAGLTASAYMLYGAKRDWAEIDGLTLRFETGQVQLSVLDEAGRIDLNTTDPKLLAGLYAAVGGRSLSPEAFGARVQDWRDEDADVTNGGAEANDYASANLAYLPRNAPFQSVDELRFLLGLSGDDFNLLAPFLTVFNPSGMIEPFSARKTVLQAAPNLSASDLAKLLNAHKAKADLRKNFSDMLGGHTDAFITDPSGTYRIAIQARLKNGYTEAAEAVVSAPRDESKDFAVLAWSRLPPPAQQR